MKLEFYNVMKFAMAGAVASLSMAVSSVAQPVKMAFVVKDMTNPYYWRMGQGAKRAAADLGVDLTWTSAKVNGDIAGQIGVVEDALVKQPNALILTPMNGTALIPEIMKANQMGIPVFTADTRVANGPAKVETFVGLDEKSSFETIAKWVVDKLGGKGKVAVLEGFRGSSTAEDRLAGLKAVLAKNPGVKLVASVAADWDEAKGLKATEDILQAHPDVNAIIASNDEMALGAVQAVKSAGKIGKIIITGDDAIPAALSEIKAGELSATIDGNTDQVGYDAVKAAYDFVTAGKKPQPWIVVKSSIIVPKDITAAYLKRRGINLK